MWEIYIIRRSPSATWLVLTKIHKELHQGLSGAEIMGMLLDSPQRSRVPEDPTPFMGTSASRRARDARTRLAGLQRYPLKRAALACRGVPDTLTKPARGYSRGGTVGRHFIFSSSSCLGGAGGMIASDYDVPSDQIVCAR